MTNQRQTDLNKMLAARSAGSRYYDEMLDASCTGCGQAAPLPQWLKELGGGKWLAYCSLCYEQERALRESQGLNAMSGQPQGQTKRTKQYQ